MPLKILTPEEIETKIDQRVSLEIDKRLKGKLISDYPDPMSRKLAMQYLGVKSTKFHTLKNSGKIYSNGNNKYSKSVLDAYNEM